MSSDHEERELGGVALLEVAFGSRAFLASAHRNRQAYVENLIGYYDAPTIKVERKHKTHNF